MFEQIGQSFRRVTESSLQTQQDMLAQWAQQWHSAARAGTSSPDHGDAMQKRWHQAVIEALESSREIVDSSFKATIRLSQHAFDAVRAKSPDQFRSAVEQIGRSFSEIAKAQAESHIRSLQAASARLLDLPSRSTTESTP